MKKIILIIVVLLYSVSIAKAEPMDTDLGQMFSDYKENEYAFLQKYIGRDLKFDALVSSVRASCYTSLTENEDPCIELEHKTYKVAYLHVIPTNIGKAFMMDNKELADLHKKQEITLICRLREGGASLVFEHCKLVNKKPLADKDTDNTNKDPLETTPEEASKATTTSSGNSSTDDYDWTFWIVLFIIILLLRR